VFSGPVRKRKTTRKRKVSSKIGINNDEANEAGGKLISKNSREAERRNTLHEADRQNLPRSELSKERSRSGVA